MLVVALVIAIPATAAADEELETLMDAAMHAEFHGSGIVMSSWGADTAAETYEVTRADDMSMVTRSDGTVIVHGGMTASLSGADWYALEVSEWAAWSMSDRYRLSELEATTLLGRPATEVIVMEGDIVRARLVIDDASTVPLSTEIFTPDGATYRMSTLTSFDDEVETPEMPDDFMERDMVMAAAASPRLPGSTHGYSRNDTYRMAASTQSFYSDGLFSFSVFESGRGAIPEEFGSATPFEVGGAAYRRIVTPNHVWVQWTTPDHSYVLVGDLPPDHLTAVLVDLPPPGTRGVIMRWLHALFG